MTNVVKAVQGYIDRMVRSTAVTGMKVLLMDKETKGIVGLAYTMSQILEREVYLVETIDATHDPMMHLKALCFLRPTAHNIASLVEELRRPKYSEYHLFFSNIVSQDHLRQLAEADERSVVKQVQEFYADFFPINADLFTLNLGHSLRLALRKSTSWLPVDHANFERSWQGMLSLLLSLRQRPFIRYSAASEACQLFAGKMQQVIQTEKDLFDFRKRDAGVPVVLILDRRDDPVTPLLSQWTYQAMVHELLGLKNNLVNLKGLPGVSKDLTEVVLSAEQDPFFAQHQNATFGDLGVAVKAIMEEYQSERTATTGNISSIDDMQKFIESYPELRKKGHTVGRHVALMSQLGRIVDENGLMDVSALEQELACANEHTQQLRELQEMLENPTVKPFDALRLVMLYALRYEQHSSNKLALLKAELKAQKHLTDEEVSLIDALLAYGGVQHRSGDLFGNKSIMKKFSTSMKRGVKGVSNVFAQHTPLLKDTLDAVQRGRLSKTTFPYVTGAEAPARLSSVIVFVLGGATYEEAARVAAMNASGTGAHIILGGTAILNSHSFIDELSKLGTPRSHAATAGGAGGGAGAGAFV